MEKTVTLWTQLTPDIAARVEITVVERGLGAIDPDQERQPTISEMDRISDVLTRRRWTATKPL